MSFKPCIAPIKVGIFPLTNYTGFTMLTNTIRDLFQKSGITNRIDTSTGTVGRRYTRADELGVPYGVTIDFQSLIDESVTVRERDSMAQVRVPISRLLGLVQALVAETVTWEYVMTRYIVVNVGGVDADEEEGEGEAAAATTSGGESKEVKASAMGQKAGGAVVVLESTPRARFSRPVSV